jgi:gamma-glutamylcyclotransferase
VTYLFSYGSNHPKQLEERLGHPVVTLPAFATNYERVFRGHSRYWSGAGVASIEKKPGATTYGLVCLVSKEDLARMDRFEGVPFAYRREQIPVSLDGEMHRAHVYIANSREFNPPARDYLKAIARTINTHWRGESGRVRPEDIPIR